MTDDLVARLKGARLAAYCSGNSTSAIDDAITALEAREVERDAVLPDGWRIFQAGYGLGVVHLDGRAAGIADDESGVRLRVLRSFLNDLHLHSMGASLHLSEPCPLKRPTPEPTFERKDGTTSPTRGDVEDRRKSAHGGGIRFGHRVVAYQRIGDHIWSTKEGMYGRRSGDRARWTAQPAPQPETKCDLCDDTGVVVDYETGLGGQCPHTWRSRPAHEIMAAAPASINSVAMTTPAPQAQPGLLDELYRGGRVAYGNDAKMYDVYRVAEATSARLDELDRRLAAMEVK